MAMNHIGNASPLRPGLLEQFRKQAAEGAREKESSGSAAAGGTERGPAAQERVEISDRAQQLGRMRHMLEVGRAAYAEEPDVRQDRLAEVRSRLQTGHYADEEVRQTVADRLGAVLRKLDEIVE